MGLCCFLHDIPIPPQKRGLAAVSWEPAHLLMAAVGSLRREERNKSARTHELFTAVLSKQSTIIYLFSPARPCSEPWRGRAAHAHPVLPSLHCGGTGLDMSLQAPGCTRCVLCRLLFMSQGDETFVLCFGWVSVRPRPQKGGKSCWRSDGGHGRQRQGLSCCPSCHLTVVLHFPWVFSPKIWAEPPGWMRSGLFC